MSSRGLQAITAALAAITVLALSSAQAATGDITYFPAQTDFGARAALGPDGNVWFSGSKLGRVTPSGAASEFVAGGAGQFGIAPGPDGNVWFTEPQLGRIGRIGTGGRMFADFLIPTRDSVPNEIALGPDGNLWFTENNKVGRITAAGKITEFPVPNSSPYAIATGPDGNVWVSLSAPPRIARVTPGGRLTEFKTPTATAVTSIAVGADGNVWFNEAPAQTGTYHIDRITPSGAITEFPLPNGGADALVAGPDGAIWFSSSGSIGRITTDGAISEFPVPGITSGITVGSDQNIWFGESGSGKVGRLLIDPATTTPPPPLFAQSFDATVVGGAVNVRPLGGSHFAPLTRPQQLQFGATIDARAGRVRIAIVDASGKLWTADVYEGVFTITQSAAEGGLAQLALVGGSFATCGRLSGAAEAAGKPRPTKSVRHLWASGTGPFRTVGRFASATIRGTTWDTDDSCDATLVKVTQGAVTVRDLVRSKTVVERAPNSIVVRPAGAAKQSIHTLATSVEKLLVRLKQGRTRLGKALGGAAACSMSLHAAGRQVDSVIDNRTAIRAGLENQSAPGAAARRAIELLRSALDHSLAADRHYRTWLADLESSHATCPLPHGQAFDAAQREDSRATAAKRRFVREFNPIARRQHLRVWRADEF